MPASSATSHRRVLLIGAGALGCAAANALAAADAARLTLVDDDVVEPSNLQRQVLYEGGDVGRPKVEAAAERLKRRHGADVTALRERLVADNAEPLIAGADIVIDACDDPATKFLLNRICLSRSVALVYGGVARTGGQWMLIDPARSACLECVFPDSGSETAQGCSALGILAPVAGLVGTMQAMAALTFLTRPERGCAGSLYVYELTGPRIRRIDFPVRRGCACRHPNASAPTARPT